MSNTSTSVCPVCGQQPRWMPSGVDARESVGCNWEPHCPEEGSFDFTTEYLPPDQAASRWNEEVAKHSNVNTSKEAEDAS